MSCGCGCGRRRLVGPHADCGERIVGGRGWLPSAAACAASQNPNTTTDTAQERSIWQPFAFMLALGIASLGRPPQCTESRGPLREVILGLATSRLDHPQPCGEASILLRRLPITASATAAIAIPAPLRR
jgi:hypothetical protein